MQTQPALTRVFLATLGLLLGTAAAACAQTVITSLPYTITSSGLYVLNSSLSSTQTSGVLLQINASNVTLDLQGHYLSGPVGNTSQTTVGIYANERANVTVRNGTIAYCDVGLEIGGNGTANTNAVCTRIDHLRVTYCYIIGIELSNVLAGLITNCQISQIGFSNANSALGIHTYGPGTTIQGNTVNNMIVTAGADSYCIYASPGSFVIQNQMSYSEYGVYQGVYQNNLLHACRQAYTGGTDGGGNVSD